MGKTRTLEARENTSDHWSIDIKFQSDWFRGIPLKIKKIN